LFEGADVGTDPSTESVDNQEGGTTPSGCKIMLLSASPFEAALRVVVAGLVGAVVTEA
jgi:hypothetical protein